MKPGYKQTEVGLIPEDWEVKPVSALVDANAPICYGVVQVGAYTEDGVPIVAIKFVKEIANAPLHKTAPHLEKPYARSRPKSGDVLISIKGTIGRVGIVPEEFSGNISRELARLRINSGSCSEYVAHQLEAPSTQDRIMRSVVGTTRLEFSIATLRQFELPIPPTKAEQRAIAEALSDVDGLLGGLDRLIAKKRDLKQAAMQQLLTAQTRLPGFHGEWVTKSFGDLIAARRDRVDPRLDGPFEFCVELEHISSATGSLLGHTVANEGASLKSVFSPGDVLFGKLRAYLRKFWKADREGVCSTEIWVLRPKDGQLLPTFLYHLVGTDDFVEAASNSYGTHMPRSDWNVVSELDIKLPPTKAEQTAIAEVLGEMDGELAALERRREKTRALKQAMMQQLLTGQTRLV